MESFTITLAQVTPVVLDVEKNMKRALSLLDDCGKRGSSILVLPELYLSGYEIKEAISTETGTERLKREVDAAHINFFQIKKYNYSDMLFISLILNKQ